MRIPGLCRFQRLIKSIIHPLFNHSVVLCYHRIEELDHDPQLLAVSPENFEAHLKVIKKFFTPISVDELFKQLTNKQIINNSVVITFDDGYADNLHKALPLLKKYNIPACIFATSTSDSHREFYWDALQELYLSNFPGWNVTLPAYSPKQEKYLQTCQDITYQPPNARNQKLEKVLKYGFEKTKPRENYRHLTSSELAQISHEALITIGAHTENHASLPACSEEEQVREICQNTSSLKKIVGKEINTLAYPYGHFSNQVIKSTQKANLSYAFSLESKTVTRFTHPLNIPRHLVRNWSSLQFQKHLRSFFNS